MRSLNNVNTAFPIRLFLVASLLVGCGSDETSPPVRIGLEDPAFNYISDDWIPRYNKMNMNGIWQSEGIDRQGFNYYFLPKAVAPNTCSERFNPVSKYFQSWFGAYTVVDNQDGVYAVVNNDLLVVDIIRLAIADQRAWLKNFAGMSTPYVALDSSVETTKEDVTIDGSKGWKITGRLVSNADVGENNLTVVPEIVRIDKLLWENHVDSYQQIYLDVVAYVWYAPENGELNVAYFNGVEFTDKNGVKHVTLSNIKPELENMAKNVTVYE